MTATTTRRSNPAGGRRAPLRPPAPERYHLVTLEVAAVRDLSRHMRRVTFVGDVADYPGAAPDQWVKLFLPAPGRELPEIPSGDGWYDAYRAMDDDERPAMRTYTVRRHDAGSGEIDIDFVLHGDTGPGSAWAERAAVGQRIAMFGPGGAYMVSPGSDWQLLVGDETGLPAIASIIERADRPVRAVIEVACPGEEQPLVARSGVPVEVTWVHRGTDEAPGADVRPDLLVDAVRSIELPEGRPYVWISGESSKVKALRRCVIGDCGIDRADVCFLGYWRKGAAEGEAPAYHSRSVEA